MTLDDTRPGGARDDLDGAGAGDDGTTPSPHPQNAPRAPETGRPMTSLDSASSSPATDSIEQFGEDLRGLRRRNGNQTLAALSNTTHVSKSVLSDAFAGRRLPTENTVVRILEVLGEDPAPWIRRRNELDPRHMVESERDGSGDLGDPAEPGESSEPAVTSPWRRRFSLAAVLWIALGTAIVSAAATSVVRAVQPTPEEAQYVPFADGVDPMTTVCREDAIVAASEQRENGAFLVQMMYSNRCMAAWGRITRYDGNAAGDQLSMTIYPAIDMQSARNQQRDSFDVQSLYTPLMIEPDVEARVCGLAAATVNGTPVELGPALCI